MEAGLEVWDTDRIIFPAECKASLTDANNWYQCLKRDAWQYRQYFQEDQAAVAAKGNDKKKQQILKQIKMAERSARTFRHIGAALGRSRTGLTKLIVPDEDGNDIVLLDKDAIHDRLLVRNNRHYGQANETILGADNPDAYLIDPDHPNNIHDKLLEGTADFDIQHLPLASREFLSCMVRSAKTDISMEITEDDFTRHYKCMPEKKSSSPSTKHVGHYIVAARAKNPVLRSIVCKIAYFALITSAPLPRWGDCLLTMLEKGKGPFIEKLRIIQIAESDFNFVLGLLWGRRLSQKCQTEKLM